MLTAVVLAKNEAANLPRCLASLSFCDHILVVDDNSTDNTAQIAKTFHADLFKHPLTDFASQRNFALTKISDGWVLFVDADEEVSVQLKMEILAAIRDTQVSGYTLPRRDYLWGQPLLHGDPGNLHLLRLAQAKAGRWQGVVHETWQVKGTTKRLSSPLYHHPHLTLYSFLHSQNLYSSLRAAELHRYQRKSSLAQILFYPLAKFVSLYILKLGFLDGTAGFVHAGVMSFYTFLVRGKLYLLAKGIPA